MGKFLITTVTASLFSSIAMYMMFFNEDIRMMQDNMLIVFLIEFAIVMIFGVGLGLMFDKIFSEKKEDEDDFITEKKRV